MKYALYITTEGRRVNTNWFYSHGHFILLETKLCTEWLPDFFDTVEAVESIRQGLKQQGETRQVKIAGFNGLNWTEIQPLHIQKAQIATDEHGN